MSVHEVAEEGFGSEAETYERARPGYPAAAVAWLIEHLRLGPGATVLDLAAGTGKLTRLLVPTGANLLAIEPVAGMGTVLRRMVPGVPVVAGTAEALPLANASLHAVTVAQAFHWFDIDTASREVARVLRPGGRIGLVWNGRDRSVDWADRVWSIMDRVEKRAPWSGHEEWRDTIARGIPGFAPAHTSTFHHSVPSTPAGVVDRIASVSHVVVLPDGGRDRVLDEVRHLLATHPDTARRNLVETPYRVDAYWCERA